MTRFAAFLNPSITKDAIMDTSKWDEIMEKDVAMEHVFCEIRTLLEIDFETREDKAKVCLVLVLNLPYKLIMKIRAILTD